MPSELRQQVLDVVSRHAQGVLTVMICRHLERSPQELGDVFESLIERGQLLGFGGLWLTAKDFESFRVEFLQELAQFHEKNPSVILAKPEEVAKLAGWAVKVKPLDRMMAKLASEGRIFSGDTGVRLQEFRPVLPDRQRQFLDRVKLLLESEAINTPNPHQMAGGLHVPSIAVEEILKVGVETGEVVWLGDSVYYTSEQLELLGRRIFALGEHQRSATIVRTEFGTTRKYAVALLTHFCPREPD
jgi:selenocysteine-specific elongation factor